jgi:hypothetical protein
VNTEMSEITRNDIEEMELEGDEMEGEFESDSDYASEDSDLDVVEQNEGPKRRADTQNSSEFEVGSVNENNVSFIPGREFMGNINYNSNSHRYRQLRTYAPKLMKLGPIHWNSPGHGLSLRGQVKMQKLNVTLLKKSGDQKEKEFRDARLMH